MSTQTESKITDYLEISYDRGQELFHLVLHSMQSEDNVGEILKKFILNFNLDTKEMILASYFLGKMQTSEYMNLVLMTKLNKCV